MKYKGLEQKIDEALKLTEDGKSHGFDLCRSGEEITLSKVDGTETKCPTKVGSFQAIPMDNIQPEVPKV